MTTSNPTNTPHASGSVRQQARAYLAELRQARQRGGVVQDSENDAKPKVETPTKAKPKVGKRGVRVAVPMQDDVPKPKPKPKAKKPAQKLAKAKKETAAAKQDAAPPIKPEQDHVANALLAAHQARSNIRAARQKQREAAAQQREKARAARQAQNARRNEREVPRWVPSRRSAHASLPKAQSKPALSRRLPQGSLMDLRGIGEAMTRRLNQAGISGLQDLVDMPTDTVRSRLGPVSALANVERWQADAKALLSQE